MGSLSAYYGNMVISLGTNSAHGIPNHRISGVCAISYLKTCLSTYIQRSSLKQQATWCSCSCTSLISYFRKSSYSLHWEYVPNLRNKCSSEVSPLRHSNKTVKGLIISLFSLSFQVNLNSMMIKQSIHTKWQGTQKVMIPTI